jgi:putative oxidoreductase
MLTADVGLLVLRLVTGAIFAGHGLQKLFGWFGGPGVRGFAGMLEQTKVRHSRFWALIVALVESVGGLLLMAGLLTPVVAAALAVDMLVAIVLVHWRNGFWITKGGMEYALSLLVASAIFGLTRGGRYALDRIFGDAYADWSAALFVIAAVVGLVVFLVDYLLARPQAVRQAPSAA